MKTSESYYYGIDLLKFMASVIILLFHYFTAAGGTIFTKYRPVCFVIENGAILVNLFFMISGFCISANYKSKIQDLRMNFSEFFKKKYIRLVSFSLLTLPIGIIKQVFVNKANLDSHICTFSDAIRDLFCIRYGWGCNSSMPYNGALWFINVLLVMYITYYFVCKISNIYIYIYGGHRNLVTFLQL